MAYDVIASCGDCTKRHECKDAQDLIDHVNELNSAGTFGEGLLLLSCGRYDKEPVPGIPRTKSQEELDREYEASR